MLRILILGVIVKGVSKACYEIAPNYEYTPKPHDISSLRIDVKRSVKLPLGLRWRPCS